jgi:hypothetical protein
LDHGFLSIFRSHFCGVSSLFQRRFDLVDCRLSLFNTHFCRFNLQGLLTGIQLALTIQGGIVTGQSDCHSPAGLKDPNRSLYLG